MDPKITQRLMREYKIEAQGVYLAMLMSQGVPQVEAYIAIFNPLKTNIRALSNQYIEKNPEIKTLISVLRKNQTSKVTEVSPEDIENYKDKDFIIAQLAHNAKSLQGKDLTDTLIKIADLQQMKKEETKDENEKVHFYLPATNIKCPNCNKKIILE